METRRQSWGRAWGRDVLPASLGGSPASLAGQPSSTLAELLGCGAAPNPNPPALEPRAPSNATPRSGNGAGPQDTLATSDDGAWMRHPACSAALRKASTGATKADSPGKLRTLRGILLQGTTGLLSAALELKGDPCAAPAPAPALAAPASTVPLIAELRAVVAEGNPHPLPEAPGAAAGSVSLMAQLGTAVPPEVSRPLPGAHPAAVSLALALMHQGNVRRMAGPLLAPSRVAWQAEPAAKGMRHGGTGKSGGKTVWGPHGQRSPALPECSSQAAPSSDSPSQASHALPERKGGCSGADALVPRNRRRGRVEGAELSDRGGDHMVKGLQWRAHQTQPTQKHLDKETHSNATKGDSLCVLFEQIGRQGREGSSFSGKRQCVAGDVADQHAWGVGDLQSTPSAATTGAASLEMLLRSCPTSSGRLQALDHCYAQPSAAGASTQSVSAASKPIAADAVDLQAAMALLPGGPAGTLPSLNWHPEAALGPSNSILHSAGLSLSGQGPSTAASPRQAVTTFAAHLSAMAPSHPHVASQRARVVHALKPDPSRLVASPLEAGGRPFQERCSAGLDSADSSECMGTDSADGVPGTSSLRLLIAEDALWRRQQTKRGCRSKSNSYELTSSLKGGLSIKASGGLIEASTSLVKCCSAEKTPGIFLFGTWIAPKVQEAEGR